MTELGADPNYQNPTSTPGYNAGQVGCPLDVAAFHKSTHAIEFLLAHGADITKSDVIICSMNRRGRTNEILVSYFKFLLEKGADPNKLQFSHNLAVWESYSNSGDGLLRPLHIAAYRGRVRLVEFLLENGAKPDLKSSNGKLARDCNMCKTAEDRQQFDELFRKFSQ